MMSMNHSNIAILNINGSDYCCIVSEISKNEVIKLMQKTNLTKKWTIVKLFVAYKDWGKIFNVWGN